MSDPILELLAAPPNPVMAVDEHSVYAGGRRRLRRRTLRRTGIGVVGVVGIAAIAFGGLGTGLGTDALPAGPSPSEATSTRATSAELLNGTYAVEVIPGAPADQPNVKFYKVANGKRTYLAGSSTTSNVVSLGTGSGADGVMIGTAPAEATKFLTATKASKGGMRMDQGPLPGTDYQAIALAFDNPTDVHEYLDTVWMNTAGEVHSSTGELLQGVKLAGSDTFFIDVYSRHMGVFTADGGVLKPLSIDSITTMGYGEKDEGGSWKWRSVTLLPVGSRDVKFTWADADYYSKVSLHTTSGTREVVAVSDATGGLSSGPRVTQVTWVDAEGTRHTEAAD